MMDVDAPFNGAAFLVRSHVRLLAAGIRFLLLACFFSATLFGCRRAPESGDATPKPPPIEARQSTISNLRSDWPLFRGNAQATGVADGGLPEKLELLWTFPATKGGFESTAAIVGGMVYIGSTDGNLYAIDLASGKERWHFPTQLGFTASAAVRDGRVYIGDSDGVFYCIDAATGRKLWDYPTDGEINSSANFHAGHVLFGSQDSFLYCLDAVSGKLAWKYQNPDQIRCFPSVAKDRGFVAGCDGVLHVIDLNNGKAVGAVKIDSPTGASPAVMGRTVFVGTEGRTFFAIDPRRQKILWRYESRKGAAAFRSSAAVTPEAVIVGSRDRQVHAFHPKTSAPLWSFRTKGRVDSSPVVVGRRVFVGSGDGRVYAIDVKTGAELWRFEAGGAVIASPAVADGRLVIGNDAGQLYCFGAGKEDNGREQKRALGRASP
jgi:outer membrane protein assembly factor BamB